MTKRGSAFRRDVGRVIFGAVFSNGLTFVSLLLFARLLQPEAIGLHALFLTIAGILITLATLRLDLALVMERQDQSAKLLIAVVIGQALLLAAACVPVVVFFGQGVADRLTPEIDSTTWLLVVPIGVVVGVLVQLGVGEASRNAEFRVVRNVDLLTSVGFAATGLAACLFFATDDALVVARIVGWACAALMLSRLLLVHRADIRGALRGGARRAWSRHRQFIVFNTPYSLLSSITRDFPLIILSAGSGVAVGAAYAMARTITTAPVVLFASSLSRVFYKEAVDHFGTPRLEARIRGFTKAGLWIGAVPFSLLSGWAPQLVPRLLGDQWELAGTVTALLAPAAWMAMQSSWCERLYEAGGRQRLSLTIQISFDAITIACVVAVYWLTRDSVLTVTTFCVLYFFYHLAYLVGVHTVVGMRARPLALDLVRGIAVYATMVLLQLTLERSGVGTVQGFGLSVTIGAVVMLVGWRRWRQQEVSTTRDHGFEPHG